VTPKMALRTHIFFLGYIKSSFTTEMVDDQTHNTADKKVLQKLNAHCYTLTRPPVEKITQGTLGNWMVRKVGILYFASYYGDA